MGGDFWFVGINYNDIEFFVVIDSQNFVMYVVKDYVGMDLCYGDGEQLCYFVYFFF